MTYMNTRATRGGTWLVVEDDNPISYRIEEGGEYVEFAFLGPVELGVGMSADVVQRCQDLFGEAFAEMHRVQQEEPGDS